MSISKEYLGDAVYAEINEWKRITLTTEDGITIHDIIYLEPEVYKALLEFVERNNNNDIEKETKDKNKKEN